jgi:hypothetical protein
VLCCLSPDKLRANTSNHDTTLTEAQCSVVGLSTVLQALSSRVLFPMRLLDLFTLFNTSSRTIALGSTQTLTEMSTRNLPGGKGRTVEA